MNKVYFTPWILFCFVSFLFISCNDEALEGEFGVEIEDEVIEDPNEFAVFQVELNGSLFVATTIVAIDGEDGLSIEASNGNRKFTILITNPFQNNFSLNPSNGQVFLAYQSGAPTSAGGQTFIAQSGNFNITNFSDEINILSGNFSGLVQEAINQESTIQMTNGVFQDIIFFNETVAEPENPNNTFMTASIDQNLFSATEVAFTNLDEGVSVTGSQENRIIDLTFLTNQGVGEFPMATEGFSATYLVDGNPQEATEGSITLNFISESYIEGSFEFTTTESTIQAGDFGIVIN